MLLDVDGLRDEPITAAIDRAELVKHQLRDRKGRWVEMGAEAKRLLKDGTSVHGIISGISGEYAELKDVEDPHGNPVAPKMMVHYSELEMINQKADLDNIGKPGPVEHADSGTGTPDVPEVPTGADEPGNEDFGFDKPSDWKFLGEMEDPGGYPSYVFDTPNDSRVIARMRASMYGESVSNPYDYAFSVYTGETNKPFDSKPDQSKHIGVAQFAGGVEALEKKHEGGNAPEALAEKHSNHISAQDQIELEHALTAVDQLMGENGMDVDDPKWEDAYAAIADLQDGLKDDTEVSKANFAKEIDNAKDAVQQVAAGLPEDSGDGDKLQHAYDLLKAAHPDKSNKTPKARLNDGDATPFDTSKLEAPGHEVDPNAAHAQSDAEADSVEPETPAYEHTPISDMTTEPDDAELESLKGYTRSGHDVINGIMRGVYDNDANFGQKIDAMKSLLQKGTLKDDTKLFRGADGAGWVENLKAGDSFSDKAFLSTSLDEKIASDFSQDHQIHTPTIIEMSTPAGTHVIDVSAIQNKTDIDRMRNQIEKEAILSPDTSMTVTSVEKGVDSKGRSTYRIKAQILTKDDSGEPAAAADTPAAADGPDTGPAPGGVPEADGLDQGPDHGDAGSPDASTPGEVTSVPFALQQGDTVTDARELRALPVGSQVTAGSKSWTKISTDQGGTWKRDGYQPSPWDPADGTAGQTTSAALKYSGFGAATPNVSYVPEDGKYNVFEPADGAPILESDDVNDLPVGTTVMGNLPSIGAYSWTKQANGEWFSESPNYYDWDEQKLKDSVDKPGTSFEIEKLGNGTPASDGVPEVDETPYTDLSSPINGAEIVGIQHFTDKASQYINLSMRNGEDGTNAKNIDARDKIKSALEKSTLKNDMTLFRGAVMRDDFVPGAVVTDKAFLSTTTDESLAHDIANKQLGGSKGAVVLEIEVPAGTHALDVNGLGASPKHENENEFILADGTALQIDSVEQLHTGDEAKFVGAMYHVKARVVPAGTESHAAKEAEPAGDEGLMEAAVVDNGGPINTSSWKKTGGPKGSNAGGFYTAPDGKKYYLKESKTPEHAKNEVLADNLYKLAGVDTSDLKLADVGDGKIGTVSEILDGGKNDLNTKRHDEAYRKKLQEGFAVDAWLANWDVAGTGFDNVMTDKDGNPVRIDPGGALLYRAMGAPKGGAFGNSVGEWNTLRDGSNSYSQAVFGDITPDELRESAKRVLKITPEQIDTEVDKLNFDPQTADKLKSTLKARRLDLAERAGLDINEVNNESASVEETADAVDTPSAKSFAVLPDPGQSGDGYFNAPGTHFWGKYGAAGVMIEHTDENGEKKYLLVQRGPMVSSNKGKWQLPGGALDSNENDYQGTAREVQEELGASDEYLAGLKPKGEVVFNHESGWHYTNIAAQADEQFEPHVDGTETGDAGWFTKEEIANLPLHPALADNLDAIFGEFDKPETDDATAEKLSDAVTPAEAAPSNSDTGAPDLAETVDGDFDYQLVGDMSDLDNAPNGSKFVSGNGHEWSKENGKWSRDDGGLSSSDALALDLKWGGGEDAELYTPKKTESANVPQTPDGQSELPDVPLAEDDVLDDKSQLDALPSGSQLMWSNGVNPDTVLTKDENGTWREPNGLEVTDGDLDESLFNGELTVHKLGSDRSSPVFTDTSVSTAPDVTPGNVPVVGFKEFGTDADGAKYVSTPDGQHIMVGTVVKSKTDGLEGTVKALEGNGEYVRVVGPDGKVKGRKIATLDVTGGKQPTGHDAPEEPAAIDVPETEQPLGYAVGEKVYDSSDLAEFPDGSIIEADGKSYKKNEDGMWEELYADGTVDKWSNALPDSHFGEYVDNPTVKQIGERQKSTDTPSESQPEPEKLADWEAELLGYVTSPESLKNAPVGSTMQVENSQGKVQVFKKVSSDGWWLDGQDPPADTANGMPSHVFDGSVEDHKVHGLTHPAESSVETFESAGSVGPDGTVEMSTPEATLPDVPHKTVGLDADGKKYVMAGDGKPMMVGTTVKSDKDGLEGTVVQVENNGTHVKVQDASGKKYGRVIKTLSVTGGKSPKPHVAETQPAPEPEPVNVPEPEPAAPDDEWFMGRVIEDYNHDSLKEAPEGTVVTDADGDFWKKVGAGEDWAYKGKASVAWDDGGNGTPSKMWGPFKVVEDPAPQALDLPEETPSAPAASAPGDQINTIDQMHSLPVGSVVKSGNGSWVKTGDDEWHDADTGTKYIGQDFTDDGTHVSDITVESVGDGASSSTAEAAPVIPEVVDGNNVSELPVGTVLANEGHTSETADKAWRKTSADTWQLVKKNPDGDWTPDTNVQPFGDWAFSGWDSKYSVIKIADGTTAVPDSQTGLTTGAQVTTATQLNDLPDGSIVKFASGKYYKKVNGAWRAHNPQTGWTGDYNTSPHSLITKSVANPLTVHSSTGTQTVDVPATSAAPEVAVDNSTIPGVQLQGANGVAFKKGDQVTHPKFGTGKVVTIENNGTHAKVVFDGSGGKKQGISGLKLTKVGTASSSSAVQATPAASTAKPDPTSPWFGQPSPEPPAVSVSDVMEGDYVPAGWLEQAAAYYKQNKNPNKTIQQSGYWNKVDNVVKSGNKDDLDKIRSSNLISQDLYDQALSFIQERQATQAAALASATAAEAKYQTDLSAWKKAHGIAESDFSVNGFVLKGMEDGVLEHTTNGSATSRMLNLHKKKPKTYTAGAVSAISSYVGSWASGINSRLRSDKNQTKNPDYTPYMHESKFKNMEKAFESAIELPEDEIVWRGATVQDWMLPDGKNVSGDVNSFMASWKPGMVAVDWGYGSTSVGTSAAFDSKPVQMKIRVPKGYKGIYVGNGTSLSPHSERELILPRGTYYYVHSVKKSGSRVIVEVEIVPQGWTPEQGKLNEQSMADAAQEAIKTAQHDADTKTAEGI